MYGVDGCGDWKGLLRLQSVLPPLLGRVWSDKHQGGVQGAPKGPGLRAEEGHTRVKIHIVNAQLHVSGDDVRIEVRFDAERSEEHTSELQSHLNLVCRLLLEKKK